MPWVNLDDNFPEHQKVDGLSDGAFRLQVAGICYAMRWDFEIPGVLVPTLVPRFKRRYLEELMLAELWVAWPDTVSIVSSTNYGIDGYGTLWQTRSDKKHRPKIPASIRGAVMLRDGGICQECGTTKQPTLDHIWPVSKGGRDTIQNLRVLCAPCNSRKGARV